MKNTGFTDSPLYSKSNDLFDIGGYVDGLIEFARECDTPMTIAIQGDWGSGKTSFMYMIKENLGEDIEVVWFNTWKFSQFELENNLATTFLTYLVDEVGKKAEIKNSLKKQIQMISAMGARAVGVASSVLTTSDAIKDTIDDYLKKNSLEIIDELKENFQSAVNALCEKKNKKRIVFFIDDLDRLQPICAVELLEVLKLFLDCDKCVFIMAIDYEVVSQGIKQKYGGLLDGRKQKKFFEKIIQVPFMMPIAHYNIDNYVEKLLSDMGMKVNNYRKDYIEVIYKSIGCNPRTMKRAFNAFLLLTKVRRFEDSMTTEINELMLFSC